MPEPIGRKQPGDPVLEQLKAELRPILERYIETTHPGCEFGAFVLNVFAMNPDGSAIQETLGAGEDGALSPMQAYAYVIESMQFHLAEWQRPAGGRIDT